MAGLFIVLEGPEGAGKSTQAGLLAAWLRGKGLAVVQTREPGGTAIGEQVRRILLDPANHAMLAEAEALLYAAARAQHVGEVIRPALEAGQVVVCDRFVNSTLAYQGGGRGLPMESLHAVQRLATGGLAPDVRLLLDLPPELGLERRRRAGDGLNRLDAAELAFHRRVWQTFHALVAGDPRTWTVIDATRGIEIVHAEVVAAVSSHLFDPSRAPRCLSLASSQTA